MILLSLPNLELPRTFLSQTLIKTAFLIRAFIDRALKARNRPSPQSRAVRWRRQGSSICPIRAAD
ncbi:MAG TPA: hypothetical protein DCL32_14630 [Gammaproteobacteria bacterium]|nr:hypothetical protein [Gammaproteobacteria bacterium]